MRNEQLKKAEAIVAQAQREQEAARAGAERELKELGHKITEARATVEALGPKVKDAKGQLAEVRAQVAEQQALKQRLVDEVTGLTVRAGDLSNRIVALQGESDELTAAIQRRKDNMDAEVSQHLKMRRADVDSALAETTAALTTAKTELMNTTTEIDQQKQRLNDLRATADTQSAETKAEVERVKTELADLAQRRPELAASIKVLEEQIRRAHIEYDQVAVNTQKAKVEHQNFLTYEAKSRKILDTKDRELMARQAEIDTSSNRLRNQRSFLTPM